METIGQLGWTIVPDTLDVDATFDWTRPQSESVYDFGAAGTPIAG